MASAPSRPSGTYDTRSSLPTTEIAVASLRVHPFRPGSTVSALGAHLKLSHGDARAPRRVRTRVAWIRS